MKMIRSIRSFGEQTADATQEAANRDAHDDERQQRVGDRRRRRRQRRRCRTEYER
jgi:hypothetical protein